MPCRKIKVKGNFYLEIAYFVTFSTIFCQVIVTNIIGVFKAIAGNDNVKVAITKSQAPSIIVEAMDHHQSSEALCANSCACLATISLRNPHNVKRIMECHGHSAVIQCMKVHPKSTQVQVGTKSLCCYYLVYTSTSISFVKTYLQDRI